MLIFPKTKEQYKNSKEKLKKPKELYLQLMKLQLKSNLFMKELISLKFLPEPNSKN